MIFTMQMTAILIRVFQNFYPIYNPKVYSLQSLPTNIKPLQRNWLPTTFRKFISLPFSANGEGVNVKPDPTIVFDILKLADVRKEDVLYVGDSGVDMQTAANANVTACGVTWGFRPRTELEKFNPAYIVDSAKEIEKLISSTC